MAVDTSPQWDTIEAVDRCLRVIEALKRTDGAGVTELAEELGWAKSTVHAHLRTLEANEYVVREEGEYVLGLRFLAFGEYVKHRKPVYSLVEPRLAELAEETAERVQFIVPEHGYCVYGRIAEGDRSVSTGGRLGRRREIMHASAAGKAILAHLPETTVESILDRRGMPELTANTIIDRETLHGELSDVRERGYALNREEHIKGLRAVATPVQAPDGTVLGAISVAGPARRMQGERFEEELPELLLGVRNEVELDVAHS